MASAGVRLGDMFIAHAIAAAAASLSSLASSSNGDAATLAPIPSLIATSTSSPDLSAVPFNTSPEAAVRLEDPLVRIDTSETSWMTPFMLIAIFLAFWFLFFHRFVMHGDDHVDELEDENAEEMIAAPEELAEEIASLKKQLEDEQKLRENTRDCVEVTKAIAVAENAKLIYANTALKKEMWALTENHEQAIRHVIDHNQKEQDSYQAKLEKAAGEVASARAEVSNLQKVNEDASRELQDEMERTMKEIVDKEKSNLQAIQEKLTKVEKALATAKIDVNVLQMAKNSSDAYVKYYQDTLDETRKKLALAEKVVKRQQQDEDDVHANFEDKKARDKVKKQRLRETIARMSETVEADQKTITGLQKAAQSDHKTITGLRETAQANHNKLRGLEDKFGQAEQTMSTMQSQLEQSLWQRSYFWNVAEFRAIALAEGCSIVRNLQIEGKEKECAMTWQSKYSKETSNYSAYGMDAVAEGLERDINEEREAKDHDVSHNSAGPENEHDKAQNKDDSAEGQNYGGKRSCEAPGPRRASQIFESISLGHEDETISDHRDGIAGIEPQEGPNREGNAGTTADVDDDQNPDSSASSTSSNHSEQSEGSEAKAKRGTRGNKKVQQANKRARIKAAKAGAAIGGSAASTLDSSTGSSHSNSSA